MTSFEVCTLFTIPLEQTVDICLSKLYAGTDKVHNLLKTDFRELILVAVKENHFIFNNNFYDQLDGVAMGSPLGPLLVNIFMSHFETNAIDNDLGIIPDMYIDDCFFIFTSQKSSDVFFENINKLHPNIKFTKQEHDNILPFLDVLITRDNDGLLNTSIYKKPTFSGLYIKWTSFVHKQVKVILLIAC